MFLAPIPGAPRYELPVQEVQYLGNTYELTVRYQNGTWTLFSGRKAKPGERLSISIDPAQIVTFQKKEGLSA